MKEMITDYERANKVNDVNGAISVAMNQFLSDQNLWSTESLHLSAVMELQDFTSFASAVISRIASGLKITKEYACSTMNVAKLVTANPYIITNQTIAMASSLIRMLVAPSDVIIDRK
jgi:hypothetical protein